MFLLFIFAKMKNVHAVKGQKTEKCFVNACVHWFHLCGWCIKQKPGFIGWTLNCCSHRLSPVPPQIRMVPLIPGVSLLLRSLRKHGVITVPVYLNTSSAIHLPGNKIHYSFKVCKQTLTPCRRQDEVCNLPASCCISWPLLPSLLGFWGTDRATCL